MPRAPKRPHDEKPSAPRRTPWVAPKTRRKLRGKALSVVDREIVLQAFAVSGSRKKVCEVVGLSYMTVCKIVQEARKDTSLAKARANAGEALAGKIHDRALLALDNLTPADFKTTRIELHDKDGNLTGIKEIGPSLMQKVTALAILVDKEAAISQHIATLREAAGGSTGIPLPSDVQSTIDAIRTRVSRLRILDVQFDQQAPDLAQRIVAATAARDIVDAEVEDVSDPFPFDQSG